MYRGKVSLNLALGKSFVLPKAGHLHSDYKLPKATITEVFPRLPPREGKAETLPYSRDKGTPELLPRKQTLEKCLP